MLSFSDLNYYPKNNDLVGAKSILGGFHSHGGTRGTPNHHPFLDGIFHEINPPAMAVPP